MYIYFFKKTTKNNKLQVAFGFGRVVLFGGDILSAFAIGASLFLIVVVSCVAGAMLPLALNAIGMDPAHAGPAIQVFDFSTF